MFIKGFEITFVKAGLGITPIANGITLRQSFLSEPDASKWLKENDINDAIKFAKTDLSWDMQSDE